MTLRRSVPVLLLVCVLVAAQAGCGGDPAPTGSAATAAAGELRWGTGTYGVVLAHGAAFDAASWEEQAQEIADQGATVLAVEDIGTESISAAVRTLQKEGHPRVALVGASAGADAILSLSSRAPDLADQLVLLSPNQVVDGLGTQPKLFVASADEPVAHVSQELADAGPGDDNVALILPGSAHAQNIFTTDQGPKLLEAVLERLAG